jgi:hypothetical protein
MKRWLTQTLGAALIYVMFACAFGSYGVYSLKRSDLPWLFAIPLAVTVILVLVLGRQQKKIEALPEETIGSEREKRDARARQLFTAVNVVQFGVIFLAARSLNGVHPEYIAPIAAAIVGVHFFALAGPMHLPSHRMAGGLLIALAIASIPAGGLSPIVVGFGGAAILWGCYALRLREVVSAL